MDNKQQEIIEQLQLLPHPEGGYYRETYRSEGGVPAEHLEGYPGGRSFSTCIYFMLAKGNFSAFHRLRQDEIWHFYKGGSIHLHLLHPQGKYERIELGSDMSSGQVPQFVVKGGIWFASEVEPGGDFSLAGCTVSPGFDFADFEMGSKRLLLREFPGRRDLVERLTRF